MLTKQEATLYSNIGINKLEEMLKVPNWYEAEMRVISDALSHGTYIGMEYGPCVEAGILANQRVVENMFQDIVLNGTSVEDAAAAANKQLNELFEAAE